DAVAHHLVDGAFVVVDGLHHAFEHWVEELARLLGVPVGQQFHRTLEVSEQHSHLLPFAFEGALEGQNLLGEMPGRVAGGAEAIRLRRGERGATGAAELLARTDLGTALGAGEREPSTTLLAEPRVLGVLHTTLGARHGESGLPPTRSLGLRLSG